MNGIHSITKKPIIYFYENAYFGHFFYIFKYNLKKISTLGQNFLFI